MGVIIVGKRDDAVRERISKFFDDYKLLELEPSENEFYQTANDIVEMLRHDREPIFLLLEGNAQFLTLLASKLAIHRKFFLGEWVGTRYRILEVP